MGRKGNRVWAENKERSKDGKFGQDSSETPREAMSGVAGDHVEQRPQPLGSWQANHASRPWMFFQCSAGMVASLLREEDATLRADSIPPAASEARQGEGEKIGADGCELLDAIYSEKQSPVEVPRWHPRRESVTTELLRSGRQRSGCTSERHLPRLGSLVLHSIYHATPESALRATGSIHNRDPARGCRTSSPTSSSGPGGSIGDATRSYTKR